MESSEHDTNDIKKWLQDNPIDEKFGSPMAYVVAKLDKVVLSIEGDSPFSTWCLGRGLPLPHRGWPALSQPLACTPLQEPLRIWEGPARGEKAKTDKKN